MTKVRPVGISCGAFAGADGKKQFSLHGRVELVGFKAGTACRRCEPAMEESHVT